MRSIIIGIVFLVGCQSPQEVMVSPASSLAIATPYVAPVVRLELARAIASPERPGYTADNAVDKDITTFMTTDALTVGDEVTIAFQLKTYANLAEFDFRTITDAGITAPTIGTWSLWVSSDSTTGFNGSWSPLNISALNFNLPTGIGKATISSTMTSWVQLRMKYDGMGAFGPSSPQFYLVEASFYGN